MLVVADRFGGNVTDRSTKDETADEGATGRSAGAPASGGERGAGGTPTRASIATVAQALPGFFLLLLADLAAVWAAVADSWTVLAVVTLCVIDGLADGIFAWVRARASWRAGSAEDQRDQVLVREFLRTYIVVMGTMMLVAYMVFAGKLLKPGGEAPVDPGGPFGTWQFWAVAAGLVAVRAFIYLWDFVRGREASVVPPAAAVSEPLRRLFVLQFGVLVGGLIVYWLLDSTVTGLAVILVAKTAIDLVLAALERLRVARIKAAAQMGMTVAPRPAGKRASAPRAGRRRRRKR